MIKEKEKKTEKKERPEVRNHAESKAVGTEGLRNRNAIFGVTAIGSRIIIGILVIALVAAVGTVAYLLTHRTTEPDVDPSVVQISGGSKNTTTDSIQLPGITTIEADTSGNVSTILYNPEGNPCYFKYNIVLDDSNQSLFTSGLIPPGDGLNGFTLNQALAAGTYSVTLNISTTSTSDGNEPLNGGAMKAKLVVK